MSEDTSIRLKKTTKEELEKLGKYKESHDTILLKLLNKNKGNRNGESKPEL